MRKALLLVIAFATVGAVSAPAASAAKPCKAIRWEEHKVKIGVIGVDCASAREGIESFYERWNPVKGPTLPLRSHGIRRTCGTLPGDGAYSYITTAGIRCAPAKRIAFRARKRFCEPHNDCMIVPPTPISTIFKGRVRYRGWSCHVKDGWELLVVSCRKRDMRFTYRTAA